MTAMLALALLLWPAAAGTQAKPETPAAEKPAATAAEQRLRRPRDIVDVAARARAVPPEFGADILIRVAALPRVDDPEWKLELLEDAFYLAAGAKEPVRRVQVITLHNGQSRSSYLSQGFDFNHDALSLQGRAILAILPLDRKRALKLLREVRAPELPPLTCEDAFGYKIDDFYTDVVGEVVNRAFSPQEIRRGDNFALLENYVKDLRSLAQVGPLAELLSHAKITAAQLADLVHVFSALLANLPADPRSNPATWTEFGDLGSLVTACKSKSVPTQPLLNAYRAYVIRRFSRRCEDAAPLEKYRSSMIEWTRRSGAAEAGVAPISDEELKEEVIEKHPDERAFWQDPTARQLREAVSQLRNQQDLRSNPAELNARFNDFVSQLDSWTGTSEKSEIDYFHQKCIVLQNAHVAAPAGPLRDGLLRTWVMFLASSSVRQTSPIEWLVQANPILQILQSAPSEERDRVLAIVRNVQEPVLALYADFGALTAVR